MKCQIGFFTTNDQQAHFKTSSKHFYDEKCQLAFDTAEELQDHHRTSVYHAHYVRCDATFKSLEELDRHYGALLSKDVGACGQYSRPVDQSASSDSHTQDQSKPLNGCTSHHQDPDASGALQGERTAFQPHHAASTEVNLIDLMDDIESPMVRFPF